MNILHANRVGTGSKHLIILHGFLGMGDNWKTHAKNWAQAGYCVHLIDQRNHGKSFWSDTFNYDVLSDDLLRYMNHHQIDSSIILGHSMGGKTAMQFACNHPERVYKLIVADIAPKAYPPHHEHILNALLSMDFDLIESRTQAEAHLSASISEPGVRQFLLKNLFWKAPGKLGLRVHIEVLSKVGVEVGMALAKPLRYESGTLFLAGEQSDYIQEQDLKQIVHHFPKAKCITIPRAGHWLHADNPKAFSTAVMDWLG